MFFSVPVAGIVTLYCCVLLSAMLLALFYNYSAAVMYSTKYLYFGPGLREFVVHARGVALV